MSEPENHTLRVLIEFRNEFKEFKTEIARDFAELKTMVANLTLALADIERRLSAIKPSR